MKQIKTIEQLRKAAMRGKAVVHYSFPSRPMPAAFMMQMQCSVVVHRIDLGLFIYDKKKSRAK